MVLFGAHDAEDISLKNGCKPQSFNQIFQARPNVGIRKIGTELAIPE
jgi:hypothetical protein